MLSETSEGGHHYLFQSRNIRTMLLHSACTMNPCRHEEFKEKKTSNFLRNFPENFENSFSSTRNDASSGCHGHACVQCCQFIMCGSSLKTFQAIA